MKIKTTLFAADFTLSNDGQTASRTTSEQANSSVETADAGYNSIEKAAPVFDVLIEYIELESSFRRRKIWDFRFHNQLAAQAFFAGKSLTIFIFQTVKNNSKQPAKSPRKCVVLARPFPRNNFMNLPRVITNHLILDT